MEWWRVSGCEEDRLVWPLKVDIPLQRSIRYGPRNQRCAPLLGDQLQDRVGLICWIAGEVDPRHQLAQQPAHEDGHCQVRRLRLPVWTRRWPRLDRGEVERAVVIGGRAA